jgi:gluconolactonase
VKEGSTHHPWPGRRRKSATDVPPIDPPARTSCFVDLPLVIDLRPPVPILGLPTADGKSLPTTRGGDKKGLCPASRSRDGERDLGSADVGVSIGALDPASTFPFGWSPSMRTVRQRRGAGPAPSLSSLALILAIGSPCVASEPGPGQGSPTIGTIERHDGRLDRIVPPDARIERLADGFDWSEGPVWVRDGAYLLFSDVPQNTIYRWKDGAGAGARVFLKPSGDTGPAARAGGQGSNGLVLDPQGRLVLCQHGDRRVARRDGETFVTLADRYQGKRFNSPNDAVYAANGELYFTDPPYGLRGLNQSPDKELDFNGVYRLAKDGTLTLLTREMTFPNGIALSPDQKTLYVANSDPKKALWMAFPLRDDGTLGPGRVFAEVTRWVGSKKGLPDGMKVDASGNLDATGPGGVYVFDPDGTHLGTLATGEATANCAFGDDGSTLYMTADMYLCRVRTKTRGQGF